MKALIFDCDGVLADTERDGHLPAFNAMFREFGVPLQWTEADYAVKLKIAGGKERLASVLTPGFVEAAKLPTDAGEQEKMLGEWHKRKSAIFQEIVASGRLAPRLGIGRLAQAVDARGGKLAVASTSAPASVLAVLQSVVGHDLAQRFAIFAGDIVPKKKPAPDIYQQALRELDVAAGEALVIEDSRNGLLAAAGAGVRCVVTLSSYTKEEAMDEAVLVVSSLGDPHEEAVAVLANRTPAKIGAFVTISDLDECLRAPAPSLAVRAG